MSRLTGRGSACKQLAHVFAKVLGARHRSAFQVDWAYAPAHLAKPNEMSANAQLPAGTSESPKKRPALRLWVLAIALGMAAFYGWVLWPSDSEISPYELSRADGKARFYATTLSTLEAPRKLSIPQRLIWAWAEFQRRHAKRNPAAYSFTASPVQLCSIHGLLNQCMEITGTKYLIAVEVAGAVEFGHTNTLNCAQWVAAFEHAIETSRPVVCYDFAKKRNFQDTLLVIREEPGMVKIVPRTKLTEYQKAGLVKADSR
jgi:hypothetical protein